jgi:hypothetical protein
VYYFLRSFRTPNSEQFFIFESFDNKSDSRSFGQFDLHFNDGVVYGTVIFKKRIAEKIEEQILAQIDDQFVGFDRKDFIVDVIYGKVKSNYSDTVSEDTLENWPASKMDVQDLQTDINKMIGKNQTIKGKLNEHAIVKYFELLNYKARRSTPEFDKMKVDVIAESENEVIYIQSKLGTISSNEIEKVVKTITSIKSTDERPISIAIIASKFPKNSEFIRLRLEKIYRINILCLQNYQILEAVPEYRSSLK